LNARLTEKAGLRRLEDTVNNIKYAEGAFKPRGDIRREATDAAFRAIVTAALSARYEKTRRLRQARIAAVNNDAVLEP
jgi:hypothetical protein